MKPEEIQTLADEIAKRLGETAPQPRSAIAALIEHAGAEFTQAMVEEAFKVEAAGGLMTHDNARRRTLGGVFFYLVKGNLKPDLRKRLFPYHGTSKKKRNKRDPKGDPVFDWASRADIVRPLLEHKGAISNVKIVLVGRPGHIHQERNLVIMSMEHRHNREMSLPRGVPQPPDTPTTYTVYIGGRQWRRAEPWLMSDPQDELIIEGTCTYDVDLGAMAVFATSVSTKRMEIDRREKQKAKEAAEAETAAAGDGLPPDAAQKLAALQSSAMVYRQKIAALEDKPPGQRFGLELTQKLLKNVEDEIAALQAQYPSS